jgi:hypothetical protein
MQLKHYSCPNCKNKQNIEIDPAQEAQLIAQARQHKAQQMIAAATSHHNTYGNMNVNPQLLALLQRAQAQSTIRSGMPPNARPPLPGGGGFAPPPQQARYGVPPQYQQQLPPGMNLQNSHHNLVAAALRPGGAFNAAPNAAMQTSIDQFLPGGLDLTMEDDYDVEEGEVRDTFQVYKPSKLPYGEDHPDDVVETSSLAAVEPPDVTYELAAKKILVDDKRLSALQLEAVVYACQRHEQKLPSGARGGFFIGDGAGIGKGRTIAGLILENWAQGRKKHLWISIGADLKFDARRDLDDAGASDIVVHALNKLPYGKLSGHKIGVKEGVIFLTYSSLVSASDRGLSRFKQLVDWCGPDFDGLVVFDESHKAKNLVPEAGGRATQVGLKVQEIQNVLPNSRVVYCSATGASEPRNMGYMVRLGLWGEGHHGFRDFSKFLEVVGSKAGGGSMAALELVAMDMKAQGMYVCRTLSFHGTEFETIDAPLEEPVASQYKSAAEIWNLLYREFLAAEEAANEAAEAYQDGRKPTDSGAVSGATTSRGSRGGGFGSNSSMIWRAFWAAHQRFFRHMCMAAKVPAAVRMAKDAVANGKCVVIGLQSTGEARTADVIADKGDELDDFVSGPKELLIRLVDASYPIPPNPMEEDDNDDITDSDEDGDEDEDFNNDRITEAAAKGQLIGRATAPSRKSKAAVVRYKEFGSDEDIGDTSSEEEEEEDSSDEEEEEEKKDAAVDEKKAKTKAATKKKKAAVAKKNAKKPAPPPAGRMTRNASKSASVGKISSKDEDKKTSASDSDSASGSGSDEEEESGIEEKEESSSESEEEENSDSEFDPMDEKRRRRVEDAAEETSLNTQQRAEKEADEELRRLRKEQAMAAFSAALEKRDKLRAIMESLELPPNPLDELIDRLGGPAAVAEMTGRKGRLVRDQKTGGVRYEPRNASGVGSGATLEMINVHERGLFLDGTKLISIISEAASAGISLHADVRVKNQRRRVHLTLELPWSADKAIQQFGRSHRANQASGPQYRLIFTPLGGERRFAAAVARRLETLGALTQGDRRAGPSLASFNYESTWGQRALKEMYAAILEERPPMVQPQPCRYSPTGEPPAQTVTQFMGIARAQLLNCGIFRHNRQVVTSIHLNQFLTQPAGAPRGIATLEERDRGDVPRFLNRLLGLEPTAQGSIFDFYQATLDDLTERARREGNLDDGIVDLKAESITLDGPAEVLFKDPVTGASTLMQSIKLDRGMTWERAEAALAAHVAEAEVLEAVDAVLSPSLAEAAAVAGGADGKPVLAVSAAADKEDADVEMKDEAEEKKGEPEAVKEEAAADIKDETAAAEDKEKVKEETDAKPDAEENGDIAAPAPSDSKKREREDDAEEKKKEEEAAGTEAAAETAAAKEEEEEEKEDGPGPSKKLKIEEKEDGKDASDVVDLTKDDVDDEEAKKKTASAPLKWESGFYKPRHELRGRAPVLLALKVPGSSPPTFQINRPTTGRARKPFTLAELKEKYTPTTAEDCKPLWETSFQKSGEDKEDGRTPMRHRKVHILCGAVMRSWSAVQHALLRHAKKNERRFKVLRIATTGEDSQRLVGMLIPEAAVESVEEQLRGEKKEKEKKEEAAAAAEAAPAAEAATDAGATDADGAGPSSEAPIVVE